MTITRPLSVAIAVGLLLAISGTNSAARQSAHLSRTHAQASVKEDRGAVFYTSRVPAFDPKGTSAYPFGPGINFPYPVATPVGGNCRNMYTAHEIELD
jgi:hypothetical protein